MHPVDLYILFVHYFLIVLFDLISSFCSPSWSLCTKLKGNLLFNYRHFIIVYNSCQDVIQNLINLYHLLIITNLVTFLNILPINIINENRLKSISLLFFYNQDKQLQTSSASFLLQNVCNVCPK